MGQSFSGEAVMQEKHKHYKGKTFFCVPKDYQTDCGLLGQLKNELQFYLKIYPNWGKGSEHISNECDVEL